MIRVVPFDNFQLQRIKENDEFVPLANLSNVSFVPYDQIRVYEEVSSHRNEVGEFCGYMYYIGKMHVIYLMRAFVILNKRRSGIGSLMINELKERINNERSKIVASVKDNDTVSQIWLRYNSFRCNDIVGDNYVFEYYYVG